MLREVKGQPQSSKAEGPEPTSLECVGPWAFVHCCFRASPLVSRAEARAWLLLLYEPRQAIEDQLQSGVSRLAGGLPAGCLMSPLPSL